MKKVFLLVTLFISYCCDGQNFQCLQPGVKQYFTNGNSYLRGMRIDSTKVLGDTVVYFPFHTPRGAYNDHSNPAFLDTNGGSWLGKTVMQLSDGTFIFDSYWNDSVIIKTQASVGDSWVFYKDTSHLYYKATVTAKDTLTVLSSPDSVKTIMITAYNDSGIVVSDPLDSFVIILSKNNGFVQVFDLYTFPYHKPDSTYRIGLDFFLDVSTRADTFTNSSVSWGNPPNRYITLFKRVDFINPNDQQMHNWNIGDILEYARSYTSGPSYYQETFNSSDTVTTKTISGHIITYMLSGFGSNSPCPMMSGYCRSILLPGSHSFSDLTFSVKDTASMPEEHYDLNHNFIYYFPNDSTFCMHSPAYITSPFEIGWQSPFAAVWPEPLTKKYKLGIGEVDFFDFDMDFEIPEYDSLVYYNINGATCGNSIDLTLIQKVKEAPSLSINPNPAIDYLTITSSEKITDLSVTNLVGQNLYTNQFHSPRVQIDVTNLQPGIYFVKVNGSDVRKIVKQ